jgi:hypothetical protein
VKTASGFSLRVPLIAIAIAAVVVVVLVLVV